MTPSIVNITPVCLKCLKVISCRKIDDLSATLASRWNLSDETRRRRIDHKIFNGLSFHLLYSCPVPFPPYPTCQMSMLLNCNDGWRQSSAISFGFQAAAAWLSTTTLPLKCNFMAFVFFSSLQTPISSTGIHRRVIQNVTTPCNSNFHLIYLVVYFFVF